MSGSQWGVEPSSLRFEAPAQEAPPAQEQKSGLTFDDVRNRFPQYNDMSDEQLATGLHKKFYADMPFEQFASKIGYTPPKRADLAPPDPNIPQTDKDIPEGALKRIGEAGIAGAKAGMEGSELLSPKAQEALDAAQREGGIRGRAAQLGSTVAGDVGKALAVPGAVYSGALGALTQTGEEIGVPGLGPAVGAFSEAFPQESMGMRGVLERAPHVSVDRPREAEVATKAQPSPDQVTQGVPESAPSPTPTLERMADEVKGELGQVRPQVDQVTPATAKEATPTMHVRPEDAAIAELEPEARDSLHEIAKQEGVAPEPITPMPPQRSEEPTAPRPLRTIQQIMDEDGVGKKKAQETQWAEIEAIGRPVSQEDMAARAAGVQNAPKAEAPLPAPSQQPFERLPPEPQRLVNFLRAPWTDGQGNLHPGGIRDDGGDIKAIIGGAKGRPGLLSGLGDNLDNATMRAWQAGFFPEFNDRPMINDLLDKIDRDHNQQPVYSMHDDAKVAAYEQAAAQNAEIDRLAAQHGIETRGITRDQFFDQLNAKLSEEDHAHEMQTQQAALDQSYKRAEAMARESAASVKGEPINLKELYGQSQARSLKDLEDEHQQIQQSEAAPAGEQRAPSAQEPRRAAAGEEPLPPSSGSRGDNSGPPGGEHAPTDTARATEPAEVGRPIARETVVRTPEPAVRNDPNQAAMPGMAPSAVQAQAARDQAGRGALLPKTEQKPADEGLFARAETPQPELPGTTLHSFPGQLFNLSAWRKAVGFPEMPTNAAFDILRDRKGLARAALEVKALFAPTSVRGAKPMERAIREHTGRSGQAYDQTFHALDQVRLAADKLPIAEQVELTDRRETGQKQPTAPLQAVVDTLGNQFDDWTKKIQGLGKGYLANAIENYMGHIWGNYPEWVAGKAAQQTQNGMQSQAIGRNVAKQPLQGSGNFLKQRYFPTQKEGIAAGLIPVTYNPVDLQLIKIHEMQKFYHGAVLADQMKASGLAKWVRESDQRDAELGGMVKLDDKIFQPKLYGASPIGPVDPGAYYAPEPLARIFNNYMSTGMHGRSSIYDGIRSANNALNSLQLGVSGFHASFVLADTTISKLALGMQQVARAIPDLAKGEFGKAGEHMLRGLGNIAQGNVLGMPLAVGTTLAKGGEMRKGWLDPAGATPEMRQVIDGYKMAGGRMEMPDFFRTANAGTFFRNLRDLMHPEKIAYQINQMARDDPNIAGNGALQTAFNGAWGSVRLPLRIAGRLIDTINQPLMGALVPRAKMGVFADLAQDWLRDHPTASKAQTADAMIKIQDSVDNRLGQLNYDNLYWHKLLKDTAFLTTRSVGWNLGTLREIGGSFVDAGSTLAGRTPAEFSNRMAYTIALPVLTAQIGGLITYLSTGQPPQLLMDYFYPRVGADRVSIPGYMKDVIAFWMSPKQTITNKSAPVFSTASQLGQGEDYYGGSIYDPEREDPATGYGNYLLNQAVPFSYRGMLRLRDEAQKGGNPVSGVDQALAFFGFNPAPKSITQPERSEHFAHQRLQKEYKARQKEPGRIEFFHPGP